MMKENDIFFMTIIYQPYTQKTLTEWEEGADK